MITKKCRMGFVAFAVLVTTVMAARSEIALATLSYTGTGIASALPTWTPFLSYGDPNDVSPLGFMNNITLSLVDIINGDYYDLTGDFTDFSNLAEDGTNQPIYVGFYVPGGSGSTNLTTEQDLLATSTFLAPDVGSPDFSNYNLTRISVIGTSYSDLGGGEFETSFEFTFYGNQVPEPSTFALLVLGLAAIVRRGCRPLR